MQALLTGLNGHLTESPVALLLERSSTTMQGILVAPGLIDTNIEGEIRVMTHSPEACTVNFPSSSAS